MNGPLDGNSASLHWRDAKDRSLSLSADRSHTLVFFVSQAGKFRRLVGTMSPPDETDEAEIYVEGKRNLVDGFVRWCKRSKVGMNQLVTVKDVHEEEPTGLYEGFYAKTK